MGVPSNSSLLIKNPENKHSKMTSEKKVLKSFEDNITAVSMDDRHVLVGLSNGKVGAVYSQLNGKEKFVTECSDVAITAVLADNFDVAGKSLFYAGDQRGMLWVLGEKGDIIDSLKVRDGPIFAIQDVEVKKVWVYSDKGRSVVVLEGGKLRVMASKNSKFSMDMDATFHKTRVKGDFPLEEIGGGDSIDYVNTLAYATDSERYRRDLVEDNKAPTSLEVVGKGHVKLRSIDMKSPVKQVLNCFVKNKDVKKDALYVLTCDDRITRFKVSELLDESIPDESLNQVLIFKDDEVNEESEDIGDIEMFTVREKKVCFIMRDTDEVYEVEDE